MYHTSKFLQRERESDEEEEEYDDGKKTRFATLLVAPCIRYIKYLTPSFEKQETTDGKEMLENEKPQSFKKQDLENNKE